MLWRIMHNLMKYVLSCHGCEAVWCGGMITVGRWQRLPYWGLVCDCQASGFHLLSTVVFQEMDQKRGSVHQILHQAKLHATEEVTYPKCGRAFCFAVLGSVGGKHSCFDHELIMPWIPCRKFGIINWHENIMLANVRRIFCLKVPCWYICSPLDLVSFLPSPWLENDRTIGSKGALRVI